MHKKFILIIISFVLFHNLLFGQISSYPLKGIILEFDLTNDKDISAKLLATGTQQKKPNNIILPFNIKNPKNNLELLSSFGIYNDFTLVNFTTTVPISTNPKSIGFIPVFSEPLQMEHTIYNLNKGLYLIKDGLERYFVYNYDYSYKINKNQIFNGIPIDSLDYITIKIPETSIGLEIENGKTTIPDCFYATNSEKIFYGTGKGKLQIRYKLLLNADLTAWIILVVKLLILLIVPLIEFFFISIESPQKRKRIFIGGIVLEILLVIGIIILIQYDVLIGFDKMTDMISTAGFALLGLIIMLLKNKVELKTAYNNV